MPSPHRLTQSMTHCVDDSVQQATSPRTAFSRLLKGHWQAPCAQHDGTFRQPVMITYNASPPTSTLADQGQLLCVLSGLLSVQALHLMPVVAAGWVVRALRGVGSCCRGCRYGGEGGYITATTTTGIDDTDTAARGAAVPAARNGNN